jgi:hypothetical protein
VRGLTTEDVTYVSLNFDNPELHKVLPWAGINRGPQNIVDAFVVPDAAWLGPSQHAQGRWLAKSGHKSPSVNQLTSQIDPIPSVTR